MDCPRGHRRRRADGLDGLSQLAHDLQAVIMRQVDRHEIGIDHAGQLGARLRLADHAQAGSVHPVHLHGGGCDHVDSPFRSTFVLTV